ncbi:hypothetical protein [Spirosoma sp. KNUC1025]|uniref:hypothetical protein n=1 Tax=Spirosoma sp. KNUC1025 TaxID=2894082 RepID=UPI001E51EB77|nr:hypothetical protein [Spirosoma sp. KNUC1025]UFH57916.1 hypothetical protein LN737_31660 [Spirosoma sp. KNUC1025]
MAKQDRPKMGDLIKQLPNVVTPVQEVRPVEKPKSAEEADVKISGFWGPADLAKRLKVHAAESGKSMRQISIEAYRLYFDQLSK